MKKIFRKIKKWLIKSLERDIERNRMLTAQILINDLRTKKDPISLPEAGFKVFSQWGEDGIIQYLISRVPVENKIFVEFGVEDYRESNTRFLLMHDNWKGLVIDGDPVNIAEIKESEIYWQYDITALNDFVTRDNINGLICTNGISGDIGLLSIDVDGNDYWIWEAVNVISPRIVICEYNSLFGCRDAVTIPYSDHFNRTRAHHSNLYFGASLKALCLLGEKKGYEFIGSESAGVNAFFVRKDLCGNLLKVDCRTGYVGTKVRESLDVNGRFTYLGGDDRIKLIADLKVIDVENNSERYIKELNKN